MSGDLTNADSDRSETMDALGRLAGGIAHDFNNMLTLIMSYTDLVLAEPSVTGVVRSDLVHVRDAADRAATLTRQLLAFSRQQELRAAVLDLNDVVREVAAMLARFMPESVGLSTVLGNAISPVHGDAGLLQQVIMNVATNARDAMPDGGELVIETANATLDDGGTPASYVLLSVSDTGIGMNAETRERIFEPFFTTKPSGLGAGFGLAMAYGIVRQSGGWIDVRSEPGLGTTVEIYLPSIA